MSPAFFVFGCLSAAFYAWVLLAGRSRSTPIQQFAAGTALTNQRRQTNRAGKYKITVHKKTIGPRPIKNNNIADNLAAASSNPAVAAACNCAPSDSAGAPTTSRKENCTLAKIILCSEASRSACNRFTSALALAICRCNSRTLPSG